MKLTLVIAASTLALVACDANPSKGKSQATTSEPMAASAAPASAVNYSFSDADSNIGFVGAKVTRKHDGSFQGFTGTVKLLDNDPAKSIVSVEIDVASIKTDQPQ